MALVYCRGCGRQISDRAVACPHCGDPAYPPLPPTASRSPTAIRFPWEYFPIWLLVVAGVMVMLVGGGILISVVIMLSAAGGSPANSADQQVTSRDGRVQLNIPGDWVKLPPDDELIMLLAGSRANYLGVDISGVEKDAVDPEFQSLSLHAELTRSYLLQDLAGGKEGVPRQIMVDGYPAIQCMVQGRDGDMEVTFIHTMVETPTTFYLVRTFGYSDLFEAEQDRLLRVVDSLHIRGESDP